MLPGTTALWGTSPGAASVMTIMAESYGADVRLVAFMQYFRVVVVAVVAALVTKLFGVTPPRTRRDRLVPARRLAAARPRRWRSRSSGR